LKAAGKEYLLTPDGIIGDIKHYIKRSKNSHPTVTISPIHWIELVEPKMTATADD